MYIMSSIFYHAYFLDNNEHNNEFKIMSNE